MTNSRLVYSLFVFDAILEVWLIRGWPYHSYEAAKSASDNALNQDERISAARIVAHERGELPKEPES